MEHSMSERVKAELTAPHALHPFHPAYQEAQLKAEEGHTWPSEKRKKKTSRTRCNCALNNLWRAQKNEIVKKTTGKVF